MPIDYSEYPPNWLTEIVPAIRQRSGDRCEGSPAYPDCRAENYAPHPITKSRVVLTTAHMDHDKTNNDLANRKYGRHWKRAQLSLF